MPGAIRVGVIGPGDLVRRTVEFGRERFATLQLLPFPYEQESEAEAVARAAAPIAEVLLFTGPVPYYRVTRAGDPGVACLYVQPAAASLYRLFLLERERIDPLRVSVDTVSRRTLAEAYADLGIDDRGVHVREYDGPIARDELVDFHLSRFHAGETTGALTYLRSARAELVRRGVPCAWVTPTSTEVATALEKAYLVGESARHKGTQIVVGVVDVDGFGRLARQAASEHVVQQLKLAVQDALLQYVAEIDGYLLPGGGDEFLFFTTRGPFERYTEFLTSAPVLDRIRDRVSTTVSMGVGMGRTASQAGTHARIALQKAKDAGGHACYVVMEDKRLLGPLRPGRRLESELRAVRPELLEQANAAGMTAAALSRILSTRGWLGAEFSANELAPVLGLTVRSAHRLLARLVNAGLASVVGEEKLATRGRPRQLYRLAMNGEAPAEVSGR